MKIVRLFVLTSIALAGCNSETKNEDKHLVSKEVYAQKLGNKEVLGVRLRLTTDQKKENLGAKVTLNADAKTFVDTLYLELRKGDTIEYEAVFSQAAKADFVETKGNVQFFPL